VAAHNALGRHNAGVLGDGGCCRSRRARGAHEEQAAENAPGVAGKGSARTSAPVYGASAITSGTEPTLSQVSGWGAGLMRSGSYPRRCPHDRRSESPSARTRGAPGPSRPSYRQ
jgi:hypothetical protein